MWHYMGGNCQVLEEELVMTRPPHDDVKDCLANVVDSAIAPSSSVGYRRGFASTGNGRVKQGGKLMARNEMVHPRFGGIN
jgi:hypothetical protein